MPLFPVKVLDRPARQAPELASHLHRHLRFRWSMEELPSIFVSGLSRFPVVFFTAGVTIFMFLIVISMSFLK